MSEKNLSVREAIISRRSVKAFNGQLVEKEDVVNIINDAVWAPNHGNRQPWRLVVGCDESLSKVFTIIRDVTIPRWQEMTKEDVDKQMAKFTAAGAYIFVIVPEDRRQKERLEDFAAASCFLQNLQLLAWDKGIGACWKTPAFIENPKFNEALDVKPGERIIAMLQLGYYDVEPKVKERKTADEIITFL